jgi:hypothetical protein
MCTFFAAILFPPVLSIMREVYSLQMCKITTDLKRFLWIRPVKLSYFFITLLYFFKFLSNMEIRLNTVLWIEDQFDLIQSWVEWLAYDPNMRQAYGSQLKIRQSNITDAVDDAVAAANIEALVAEAGNKPTIINVQTAQTARAYLGKYVPGAVICDSSFPLNGAAVVGWLQQHGLPDYPLIGLSGKDFGQLEPQVQKFFYETSARYFCKGGLNEERLAEAVISSRLFVQIRYNP